MSSFRYAGLGASLGVPQSALESVTSLDPKDYVYPNLDSDFMFTSEGQLGNKGSKDSMQVFSYETACSRERAQSAALLLGSGFGGESGRQYLSCIDLSDVLEMDTDGLNFLKVEGGEKAMSEENSDKSTTCTAARVSPRRSSATSGLNRRQRESVVQKQLIAPIKEEDEEEDLLVAAESCFNGLDAELLSSIYQISGASLERDDGHRTLGETGKRQRKPKLSLSLDYDAAVASINSQLEADREVPTSKHLAKKLRINMVGNKVVQDSHSCESSPSMVKLHFADNCNPLQV